MKEIHLVLNKGDYLGVGTAGKETIKEKGRSQTSNSVDSKGFQLSHLVSMEVNLAP